MNTRGIPVSESIDTGWNTFKDFAGFAIGVMIAVYLIPAAMQWLGEIVSVGRNGPGPFMWIAVAIVEITLELGAVNVFLKLRDGRPAEFADLFNIFPRVPVFFVSVLVAFMATVAGLLLLIVPGIILAVRLQFIPYILLDEDVGPIDAVQRSWDLTRGFTLDLFLYALLLMAINFLGFLALGIGLFVSIPVTKIAMADVYRYLQQARTGTSAPATPVA